MKTRPGLVPARALAVSLLCLASASACSPDAEGAPTTSATPTPSASASPEPVTVERLGEGDQPEPVDIELDGPAQVDFARIVIAPGAGTGEHCHHGNVVGVVESGQLTHYAPTHPGGVRVYGPGESLVEGPGYVHQGVNEGDVDLVLWVTYLTPEGQPLAETDLSHCEPADE